MTIEWTSILFIILILIIDTLILKLIEIKTNLNGEIKRKLFHITMGLVTLTFPHIFKNELSIGILGILALIIFFILKHSILKNSLGTILYSVSRESLGEIFFVIDRKSVV